MRQILIKKRMSGLTPKGVFFEFREDIRRVLIAKADLSQSIESLMDLFNGFCETLLETNPFFASLPDTSEDGIDKRAFSRDLRMLIQSTSSALEVFPSKHVPSTGKPLLVRLFKDEVVFFQDRLLEHHIEVVVEALFNSAKSVTQKTVEEDPSKKQEIQIHIDFVVDILMTFLRLGVAISKNEAPEEMNGLLAYLLDKTKAFDELSGCPSLSRLSAGGSSFFSEPPKPDIWCNPPERKPVTHQLPPPALWMRLAQSAAGPIHWLRGALRYPEADLGKIPVAPPGLAAILNYFSHVSAAQLIETILELDQPFLDEQGRPFLYGGTPLTGKNWFEFKPPLPMFRLELFPGRWMVVALDPRVAAGFAEVAGKGPVIAVERLIGRTAFTQRDHKEPFKHELSAEMVHSTLAPKIVAAAKRFLAELAKEGISRPGGNSREETIELFMNTFALSILGLEIRDGVSISHIFGKGLEKVTTLTFQQLLGLIGAPSWVFPLPEAAELSVHYRQIVADNPHTLVQDWRMSRMLTFEYHQWTRDRFSSAHTKDSLQSLGAQLRAMKDAAGKDSKVDYRKKVDSLLRQFWPPSVIVMDGYSSLIRRMTAKILTEEPSKTDASHQTLLMKLESGKRPKFDDLCSECGVSYSIHTFLPYDLLDGLMGKEASKEANWQKDPQTARQKLLELYQNSEKRRLKNALRLVCHTFSAPGEPKKTRDQIRAILVRSQFECANYDDLVSSVADAYPNLDTLEDFEFVISEPPVLDRWVEISIRTFRMMFIENFFGALNSPAGQKLLSSFVDTSQSAWARDTQMKMLFPRQKFNIEDHDKFLQFFKSSNMICRISVQAGDVMHVLQRIKESLSDARSRESQDPLWAQLAHVPESERAALLRQHLPENLFHCPDYNSPQVQGRNLRTKFIEYMSSPPAIPLWKFIEESDLWEITPHVLAITMALLPALPLLARTLTSTLLEREIVGVDRVMSDKLNHLAWGEFQGKIDGYFERLQAAVKVDDRDAMAEIKLEIVGYLKSVFPEIDIAHQMIGSEQEKRQKYNDLMTYFSEESKRKRWLKVLKDGPGGFQSELLRIFYTQGLNPMQYKDSQPSFFKSLIRDRYNLNFYKQLPKLARVALGDMDADEVRFVTPNRRGSIEQAFQPVACENKEALIDWLMTPECLERLANMAPESVKHNCFSEFAPIIPSDYELDFEELRAVMGVILAGSETSANAMLAVFSQMTDEVQKRLVWEIRSAIQKTGKTLDELLEDEFTKMTDSKAVEGEARGVRHFPNLEDYINRVVACYPPAPAFVRESDEFVQVETMRGESFTLPPHTLLIVPGKEINRQHVTKSFTFADGGDPGAKPGIYPRRCPGQYVAMFEIKALLVLALASAIHMDNCLMVENIGVARGTVVTKFTRTWKESVDAVLEQVEMQHHRSISSSSLLPARDSRHVSETDTDGSVKSPFLGPLMEDPLDPHDSEA